MTKVISCVNLKGGVGKTALAVNLAAYCGLTGTKTLLVDLDPQTNFAKDLDVEIKNAGIVLSRIGRPSLFREQTTQSIRDTLEQGS